MNGLNDLDKKKHDVNIKGWDGKNNKLRFSVIIWFLYRLMYKFLLINGKHLWLKANIKAYGREYAQNSAYHDT